MDVNMIVEAISSLGFPIVVCAAMFWYINKRDQEHKDEVSKLRESLDKNTEVITKLLERLGT